MVTLYVIALILIVFDIGLALYLTLRTDGYMRIDTSDPSKDTYLLELTADLDKLPKRKRVCLKIDSKYKKPQ